MPYIELLGRGDRLGANITTFIAQILYAIHNKLYIKYNRNYINHGDNIRFVEYNQRYNNSIFIETLFDFIDNHNDNLLLDDNEIKMYTIDYFEIISKTMLELKVDLVSYFRDNVLPKIINNYNNNALKRDYKIPFNSKKSICVHLRLDDMRYSRDYNGLLCSSFFRKYIDDDIPVNNTTDNLLKSKVRFCNYQAPIDFNRIKEQIDIALAKYTDHEFIIITNPGENLSNLPYKCIQSNDESYDLYLLCNSNVVILSRSTYAISSLFFGIANELYIPLWGHLPCFGIYTKYDRNTNFNFFT